MDLYIESMASNKGDIPGPSNKTPLERFVENVKESIKTSPLRRLKALRSTEKAIKLLKDDPEAQKNTEVIKKIFDSFTYFGLTHASYNKTISMESVQTFYDIVKKLGTKESERMIEQLDREISIHPDTFKKKEEEERLAKESAERQPGE